MRLGGTVMGDESRDLPQHTPDRLVSGGGGGGGGVGGVMTRMTCRRGAAASVKVLVA